MRASPRSEDVEDEFATVEHLALGGFLDLANLRRCQVVVEDHNVRVKRVRPLANLLQLPLPHAGSGVKRPPPLHHSANHDRPGRFGQLRQFRQWVANQRLFADQHPH